MVQKEKHVPWEGASRSDAIRFLLLKLSLGFKSWTLLLCYKRPHDSHRYHYNSAKCFFDHSVVYFKILEELMEFTFPPVSLAPHMSWADMVLLSVLPPEFSVVAKAGVKEYPFFGSMSRDLILCGLWRDDKSEFT